MPLLAHGMKPLARRRSHPTLSSSALPADQRLRQCGADVAFRTLSLVRSHRSLCISAQRSGVPISGPIFDSRATRRIIASKARLPLSLRPLAILPLKGGMTNDDEKMPQTTVSSSGLHALMITLQYLDAHARASHTTNQPLPGPSVEHPQHVDLVACMLHDPSGPEQASH